MSFGYANLMFEIFTSGIETSQQITIRRVRKFKKRNIFTQLGRFTIDRFIHHPKVPRIKFFPCQTTSSQSWVICITDGTQSSCLSKFGHTIN